MKRKIFVGWMLFLMGSSSAWAKEEVFLNSLGFSFGSEASETAFSPGYNRSIGTWLQIGGQFAYEKLKFGATNLRVWTLQAGPTFNLGPVENAWFLSAGLAFRRGNGSVPAGYADPSGNGFYTYAGKRFGGGSFAYRPSIGVQTAGGMNILLNFLSVAIFF